MNIEPNDKVFQKSFDTFVKKIVLNLIGFNLPEKKSNGKNKDEDDDDRPDDYIFDCTFIYERSTVSKFIIYQYGGREVDMDANLNISLLKAVRDTSIVFSLFIIYLLSFFPLFTHDIILISTDHFLLWLSSIVLHSLLYIYTHVLVPLLGPHVACVCISSRIKIDIISPLTKAIYKYDPSLKHFRGYLSSNSNAVSSPYYAEFIHQVSLNVYQPTCVEYSCDFNIFKEEIEGSLSRIEPRLYFDEQ